MVDNRTPEERELGVLNEPQPAADTVEVDAGTSSAIHEVEVEAKQLIAGDVAQDLPLEERIL
ncbi:MAG: hypothetical protein JWN70_3597 [Planctomycetaceae bacterium]|nr:hypothetical protein [Planctomycetaceae bacterium]